MTLKIKRSDSKIDPMWLTDDEDERRAAIIQRAAEGARRTLGYQPIRLNAASSQNR